MQVIMLLWQGCKKKSQKLEYQRMGGGGNYGFMLHVNELTNILGYVQMTNSYTLLWVD